ncbi:MAG: SulP family inorganic anion transporter [Gammaproteobacteria bacterium]
MYRLSDFTASVRGDIYGGITAAVVALPLALAFGIASGAGPIAGLYGAVFVGLFAALFGGTRTQISGPTGPMTVVMTSVLAQLMADYPEQGVQMAFTTVMLAGLIQIAMGLLKLGRYIIMVPYPVISGFMSGIGVIIILLQVAPLLGFAGEGNVLEAALAIPAQLLSPNPTALALGLLTLAIVFLWPGRWAAILPAPLVALIVGTLVLVVAVPDSGIGRIGNIPSGFPALIVPHFEWSAVKQMLTAAVMLAVLGAIDSLLTSLVADNLTRTHHHSNRELIGQGMGNAMAGLFGGLPGAGATMRTLVNVRAGGKGPLSGTLHSLVLLAIALGLGWLFEDIPLVVLAGILIKVGIDIIDWPFLRRMHRLPWFSVALMILVLLLTVFADLITAVMVGVFIKNMVTIEQMSHYQLDELVLSDGVVDTDRLSPEERDWLHRSGGEILLLRIAGPVSYAVGRGLSQRMCRFGPVKTLYIDFSRANLVGISTPMLVEDLIATAHKTGTVVELVGMHGEALHELSRAHLTRLVGSAHCHPDMTSARAADARSGGALP